MRFMLAAALLVFVLGTGAFLFSHSTNVAVGPVVNAHNNASAATSTDPLTVPEAPQPTSTSATGTNASAIIWSGNDLLPQSQLANPPAVIKGIYLTGWSAGSAAKMREVINLIKNTELNAVV